VKYHYKRKLDLSYEAAVQKATVELKKEGFGIPSQINVRALLKEKLNVDFDNYVILGTCNPPIAYQALQAEPDIGLMMPCNVIVYEKAGETFAACILPTVSMNAVGNEKLKDIAGQVEQKLKKVIDSIKGEASLPLCFISMFWSKMWQD
jgi:uncharacterized protein (DUF302 family)